MKVLDWPEPGSAFARYGILALGVVAIVVVVTQVIFIVETWLPYPVNDHLYFIVDYSHVKGCTDLLRYLFTPHNEHIMPIPKLIMMLDFEVFDGSMSLLLAMDIFSWILLTVLLLQFAPNGDPWGRRLFSLLTICLFSFSWGLECFFWSFSFQQLLVLPISILAIHLGIAVLWRRSTLNYLLAIALSLAAIMTSAQGLLVLPILTIAPFLARRSMKMIWAFGLPAAVVWGVYFLTLPTGSGGFLHALTRPVRAIRFLSYYFGVPLTSHPGTVGVGQVAGLMVVIGAIAILTFALWRGVAQSPNGLFWVSSLLFGGGVAVVIAMGRLHSIETLAPSSRYWPFIALVLVSSCALVLIVSIDRVFVADFLFIVGVIIVATIFLFVHLRVGENWIEWADGHKAAVSKILDGSAGSEEWLALCNDPEVTKEALDRMFKSRTYIFRNHK